jgi:hypothetical protein
MEAILITAIIAVTLLCIYFSGLLYLAKQTDKFQETCALHDICYFYNGEKKEKATITAVFDHTVIVEDEDGDAHHLSRCSIYPCPKYKLR